jgi:hypothetical protein
VRHIRVDTVASGVRDARDAHTDQNAIDLWRAFKAPPSPLSDSGGDGNENVSGGHGGGGGGGNRDGGDEKTKSIAAPDPLSECTRLDLQFSVTSWHDWFPALLRRLPSLARLELQRFPERLLHVLRDGAPSLTALHIADNQHVVFGADPLVMGDDRNFAFDVLTSLPALRALALPYATVPYRDLFVAADRLESLEVRLLTGGIHRLRHTPEFERTMRATRMTKLTRLVTDVVRGRATAVLRRMPVLRRGRIGFRNKAYASSANAPEVPRLVAELNVDDRDYDSSQNPGFSSSSSNSDSTSSSSSSNDAAPAKEDALCGVHISWRLDGADGSELELPRAMCKVLASLSGGWTSNAFDARVPNGACDLLDGELALTKRTTESIVASAEDYSF